MNGLHGIVAYLLIIKYWVRMAIEQVIYRISSVKGHLRKYQTL